MRTRLSVPFSRRGPFDADEKSSSWEHSRKSTSRNITDRSTTIKRSLSFFDPMADMRLVVIATIFLTLIVTGEIQRCSGQVHYKQPGWGPGGKRSPVLTENNVFRKQEGRPDSQLEEVNTEQKHDQLALFERIAKHLAQKQRREVEAIGLQTDWN